MGVALGIADIVVPSPIAGNVLPLGYTHEQAVVDGVNVNYDVYRIQTRITAAGSKVEAGFYVEQQDRETREKRWQELDEAL